MKIKIFVFAALMLLVNAACINAQPTGNPYEDAAKFLNDIRPDANGNDLDELISIVSYYSDRRDINSANIAATIAGMPFLKIYAPEIAATKKRVDSLAALQGLGGTPTGVGSGVLGVNVTNIADGIAKFLIERGKQELSLVFFERLQETLQKFPELTFLFPSSAEIIHGMESYNILSLLQELKDAFMKDLLNMPSNILSLRYITTAVCNDAACQGRIAKINTIFTSSATHDPRLIILPLITIQGIIDGDNIIEIANKMGADASVCALNDNFSGFVQLSSLLLESLKTPDSEGLFLSKDKIKNLFYSRDMLNVFLGLIYQKYNCPGFSCYSKLTISGQDMQGLFTLILNGRAQFFSVLTTFDKINNGFVTIQKNLKANLKPDIESYTSIAVASITMLINLNSAIEKLIPAGPVAGGFSLVTKNLAIAAKICADIQQKNYAGIFNGTIKFINDNNIIGDNATREKLVRYLSFGANLASAKTSDEVKEAINTAALPPGSYSIKHKSSLNISFNGYVGYAWDFNSGIYANGVYAPVGFSVSRGLGKKYAGAITIFTSLIDVGSVVSYRLKDDTTDELKQEIRLESILSPSAQVFFEVIPRTPIAIGFGWRRTPKLFYSDDTDFTVVKAKDVFNLSVLIDIPIFTIKNSPYR